MGLAFDVFLAVILSVLCWLVGTIYIKALYNRYASRIVRSKDVNEAINLRKRYRFFVSFERLIYAVIALVGCILICEVSDYIGEYEVKVNERYFSSPLFWCLFVLCEIYYVILMVKNNRYSPITNLSHIRTIDQKLNKPFILFLRGFGTDIYSVNFQEKRKNRDVFSEHNFIKRLLMLYNVYAVGRPEELQAPSGAARIYLDNATWQQDVQRLMKEALFIVILVSDKQNCVWEIEQTAEMRTKTIYIINNREKYNNVKHLLPAPCGTLISPNCKHFVLWTDKSGNAHWMPFSNGGNSYWNVIRIIEDMVK